MSANDSAPHRKRDRKIQSCAECRRLKLRCDRGNPCSSCVRRGLQSLCPTGTVSGSWKGNRTILASTEDLHQQNERLSSRVRELENALSVLQASTSDKPHPLLSEELLLLKLPLGVAVNTLGNDEPSTDDVEEDIVDAFGTLHIATDGSGIFYGNSAPSEMLIHDGENPVVLVEDELPLNILLLSNQFPFNTAIAGSSYLLAQMRAFLPPLKEAWRLCELYFDNAAWLYRPFSRVDFIDEIITPVYEKKGTTPISGAQLSLLYITMATGMLVDFDIPAYSATARQYQLLARACLSTSNVLVDTPLIALYSIFGICYYLQFTDEKGAMAECLVFQGMLVKMAQSMGLHRDPENFKLAEVAIQRRRRTFWEIYLYDMWMGVVVGRPPAMSSAHIDTKMPIYPEDEGDPKGYHHTKLEVGQEYLRNFHDNAFSGSQKLKYKRVLQLDSDMRTRCVYSKELLVPGLDGPVDVDGPKPSLATSMQRNALYMIREVLLFYLHRGCFAHALEGDKDPLESGFAPSVLATYRSARGIMACLRHSFATEREATLRLSWFWSHAASSAVIFAALATFAPGSLLAAPALAELDQACELFQQATSNRRIARFMPTVQKMQMNAHDALLRWNVGQSSVGVTKDTEELSAMAGATHLVCRATNTPIFTSAIPKPGIPEAGSFCVDGQGRALQFEGAHDSLMDLYAVLQQQPALLDPASTFAGVFHEEAPVSEEAGSFESFQLPSQSGGARMDWAQLVEQLGVFL